MNPITHQRQGTDECKLAALAMLVDRPLDEIRQVALNATGLKSWRRGERGSKKLFWIGVEAVCRRYGLRVEQHVPLEETETNAQTTGYQHVQIFRDRCPTPDDLVGRGELRIFFRRGLWDIQGHSVVFDGPTIYDPNLEGPMNSTTYFATFLDRYYSQEFVAIEVAPTYAKDGTKL